MPGPGRGCRGTVRVTVTVPGRRRMRRAALQAGHCSAVSAGAARAQASATTVTETVTMMSQPPHFNTLAGRPGRPSLPVPAARPPIMMRPGLGTPP